MSNKTRSITEAGLMIALGSVLSLITIFRLPQGGSITAASMVPIILYSLRWGFKKGIITGGIYGLIQYLIAPTGIFHPIQFLLDYPIAFAFLGLSGLVSKKFDGQSKNLRIVLVFSGISIICRLFCHILSGAIFFKEFAGSQNPWIYSLIYNSSYLLVELILSLIVIFILYKPLARKFS